MVNHKYYFNRDTVFYEYTNSISNYYFSSYFQSGWVEFHRLDDIVSGEFELKLYQVCMDTTNPKRPISDTLEFTQGRFDITK